MDTQFWNGIGRVDTQASLLTYQSTDLISQRLGGRVLRCSDEWFAEAENLINPVKPITIPGKVVYTGGWYDGWETRRHNRMAFDWVVIRLGVATGRVAGAEIDTAFFNGNEAPAISIEGCVSDNDDEVVSWGHERGDWEPILGYQACGPTQRQGWKLAEVTEKAYTHVRLNMYPDGGIARFRLYGLAVPNFPADSKAIFDLAAAVNGGVAVACSDQHFGTVNNLLVPGRGKDMGDGWETKRSRAKGHVDWVIVKLGARGIISHLVVDTAHFRGNFPREIKVEGIDKTSDINEDSLSDESGWRDLTGLQKGQADKEMRFDCAGKDTFTHVKLTIVPDGGVKRIRVFGQVA